MGKKVDLTGQRFGAWTVLGDSGKRSSGSVMWDCVCDCGETREVSAYRLVTHQAKSCGCVRNEDLTGRTFGYLTVEGVLSIRKNGYKVWRCRCSCGNYTDVITGNLKSGQTKSCGCIRGVIKGSDIKNFQGKKFGKLTVIKYTDKRSRGQVLWECACDCGTVKYVQTSNLNSGNTKSCGCTKSERLSCMIGTKNHSYNPNLTDEDRLRRRYYLGGGSHRSWSKQTMERDNYTCQICNQHGGKLNAHHLNGWNAFPEQRFDLDNGVTLCTDCHKDFHSQYGYGDNTREQFNEYAASKTLVLN